MTLWDLLMLLEGDGYLPLTIEKLSMGRLSINCIPESVNKIEIRFMCEEETWVTVSTFSPILVPWYDCKVDALDPVDENTIGVWLDQEEYLMKGYRQYIDYKDHDIESKMVDDPLRNQKLRIHYTPNKEEES